MAGDISTSYEVQKFAGMWNMEATFDNKQDAENELEWCRKCFKEYKWRIVERKRTVLWEA